MLVYRHDKAPELIVRRKPERTEDETLTVAKVADALGISATDVRLLIDSDLLDFVQERDGARRYVEGESFNKFIGKLRGLELVEQSASPEPPEAMPPAAHPEVKSNPRDAARPTKAAAPTRAAVIVHDDEPEDEDEDDDEEDGYALLAECPACAQVMGLDAGVLMVECPGCGKRLQVVEPEPEKPVAKNPAGFRLFDLGRRRR